MTILNIFGISITYITIYNYHKQCTRKTIQTYRFISSKTQTLLIQCKEDQKSDRSSFTFS